jgi:hypothetical protein
MRFPFLSDIRTVLMLRVVGYSPETHVVDSVLPLVGSGHGARSSSTLLVSSVRSVQVLPRCASHFLACATKQTFFFQQPLMTLIFGKLTQGFINFKIVRIRAEQGLPEGLTALPEAAAHSKWTSTSGVSHLVYIGITMLLSISFR